MQGQWGQAFDAKLAAANFAIDKHGGDELRGVLNATGLSTNPNLMNMLSKFGEIIAEESGEGDGGSGDGLGKFGNTMTPDEARAKGNSLLQEANNLKMGDPRRKKLNEEAQSFFRMATGGK